MRELIEGILAVLVFTAPAFVLPLILGPIILRSFGTDTLSRMAGWFSMKPLLATPLWALIVTLEGRTTFHQALDAAPTLIPGIGLTLWIVWRYRHLLRTEMAFVIFLIVMDVPRWLNSFAWLTIDNSADSPFYMAGLILPNVYAAISLAIAWVRQRRSVKATRVQA